MLWNNASNSPVFPEHTHLSCRHQSFWKFDALQPSCRVRRGSTLYFGSFFRIFLTLPDRWPSPRSLKHPWPAMGAQGFLGIPALTCCHGNSVTCVTNYRCFECLWVPEVVMPPHRHNSYKSRTCLQFLDLRILHMHLAWLLDGCRHPESPSTLAGLSPFFLLQKDRYQSINRSISLYLHKKV